MIGAGVEILGLCKHFDQVRAVDGFSLSIKPGEFVSVLGASGSGKSTVLRILAGLEEPTSGSIAIDGTDATSLPPERRNIGMVFQDYALFPHMTLLQNIGFPLRMRGVPADAIAGKVAGAMRLVGIEGLGGRKPSQISGGQQQRVALARALVFEPKLLLLDEPLSALDKSLREHMKAEIKSLHRRLGVTIVYVTHDQSEALALSDRVVVMRHGKIVDVDTPERLYSLPSSRYIAGFIGEANLIEGRIEGVEAGTVRIASRLGSWSVPVARVRLPEPPAPGRDVLVVVRPEDVIVEPDTSASGVLTVACKVMETLYNGSHSQIELQPDGLDITLTARSNMAAARRPEAGATARIGLPSERAVVVDPEA